MQTHRDRKGRKTIRLTKRERAAFELARDLASDIERATDEANTHDAAQTAIIGINGLLKALDDDAKTGDEQGQLELKDADPMTLHA